MTAKLPRILITMGDPNGIGPEIALKAVLDEGVCSRCEPVLVGCPDVMDKAAKSLGLKISLARIAWNKGEDRIRIPPSRERGRKTVPVVVPDTRPFGAIAAGRVRARAGRMAVKTIEKAHAMMSEGLGHALVTCPINKEAIHRAGFSRVAHTEILAHLTGTPDPLTLFVCGRMWIAFFTRHLSLAKAVKAVRKARLIRFVKRLVPTLEGIGKHTPRLALAALNPHAGEGGLMGREEIAEIEPAVRELCRSGIDIQGPVPADAVFHAAREGRYDCVVALYHDQGHIAAKTARFHDTVSLTLGMPYLRASVDHGTGFDIAWEGRARPDSLLTAIRVATRLVKRHPPV